ncbi:MAG: glycosyltransferase family 4 protein [Verrucomicrobia bacterium]|nr:glycosyltransferase family 4 protein [Verrucomicrobiota bacterium]
MPKLLGITQSGFCPASRFRFIQFIPYLEQSGWQVDHRPNNPDRQWKSPLASRVGRAIHYRMGRGLMRINRARDLLQADQFDVIYVGRDLASEGPIFQSAFQHVMRKSVYDFDDAIFTGRKGEKIVRWLCQNAAWVTPGNEYLAQYARQYTDRITIIPTVVDTDGYVPKAYDQTKTKGTVRIGWSGSDQSIGPTLLPYLPMLENLQRQADFELVVITNTRPTTLPASLRWKFIPWKKEEEASLQEKFDIGIMPLADDPFQKGKCALKLLQYMAAGLPTVASPVGANREVVQHQVTGLLAGNDNEWYAALKCLLQNFELRAAMGIEGRKRCEEEYSVKRWLPVMLDTFEKVRSGQNH